MDTPKLIDLLIDNFDFAFMIVINVLTYLIIKLLDWLNGPKDVTTWQKRLILIVSIIIISAIYYICGFDDHLKILNSAILAPVFWSWVMKPILKKLNLDYKKIDDCLT